MCHALYTRYYIENKMKIKGFQNFFFEEVENKDDEMKV